MQRSELDPDTEMSMRLARVKDIQDTAQALLDDPEAFEAFHRVGVSGNFSTKERTAIYGRLGLGSYYKDKNLIVALDYQGIIQALARRVASRIYDSVFSEEAHAYALSNTFLVENYNGVRGNTIDFSDFLIILHEFMQWDEIDCHVKEIVSHKFDESSELSQDDQIYELMGPLHKKNAEIFRKYGQVGKYTPGFFNVAHVALKLIRDGQTADNIPAVRDYLLEAGLHRQIKGIM